MALARDYQDGTQYRRDDLPGGPADQEAVSPYKHYPDDLQRIELPHPGSLPTTSFWETVARRRSVRQYASTGISRKDLFLLLYADDQIGPKVAAACLDQVMCRQAACNFLWTAVFSRTFQKYGDRGLRYVYLDAGHVGHSLQLAATALGLGCCNIAALFDSEVNELLGLDGRSESIVYAASVGPPS